ncbi:TIGR04283 family arsenosugar biosynthesis glycosyltransferase [Aquibacillus kalidii]|uniref:TIGR04283 family arsenosugar biosynthesis glycosyltransferase n=1 Tax=Aquibacillus kalidii TaxID=2762597 RepID=UPI0016465614|nr:TIGR04283 family arsenosugar biosynthesis glycosyltransferase [Aquibacillus kalidii]
MRISVIIPTLNERGNIEGLCRLLGSAHNLELIIADGGSTDGTIELAKQYGRVISSAKGRAIQMNNGARIAKGKVLWFLHADSVIHPDMISEIDRVLKNPTVIGGGFPITFDDPSVLLKIIAKGSNLRAKYFHLIFGDQGFFIRKSHFFRVGLFPEVPLMEDWILSRKSNKLGKLVLLPTPIITSSRRFREKGIIRTFLLMQKIKLLFICGVPLKKLERMYRRG